MPRKTGGLYRPKVPTTIKSYSWSDLDHMGWPRDHFYNLFCQIGQDRCPNCDHHHIGIRRIRISSITRGWEWRCMRCNQIWMTPNVTPGLGKRYLKLLDSQGLKSPDSDPVTITEYKY